MSNEPEEGGPCPDCGTVGLILPVVDDCSCHIAPPCGPCVDNRLVCTACEWEDER